MGCGHCVILAWKLSFMSQSAKGLIARSLLGAITTNMELPPNGWERFLSIEEGRPDGFPAIAFVHLDESKVINL